MSEIRRQNPNKATTDELAEYKEAFEMFDTERIGFVDIATQLIPLMKMLGVSPSESELMKTLRFLDLQSTGKIAFADFVKVVRVRVHNESAKSDIEVVFQVFDKEGSGYISTQNFRHILKQCRSDSTTSDDIEACVRKAQTDGGIYGKITFQNFANVMQNDQQ